MSKYTIPFSHFVDITSQSVKSAFSVGRLNALAITKPELNLPFLQECMSLNDVETYYGINSKEYEYASIYFSFISKLATKAELLTFCNIYDDAQPAVLQCNKQDDITKIKQNGSFTITIGAKSANVEVNMTQCVSLTDCATAIQTALRAAPDATGDFTNATCEWSSITKGFIIKSGVKGSQSKISMLSAGTSGVDLAPLLFGRDVDGAIIIEGTEALSIKEATSEIIKLNGNYYSISIMQDMTGQDDEIIEFAKLINANQVRFCGVVSVNDLRATQNTDYFKENFSGYNGLLINFYKDYSLNAFTQAFIASLDFQALNANQNCNFISASTFETMIGEASSLEYLAQNRLNSVYEMGGFGQSQKLYGEGKIMGDIFKNASVYFANSYLVLQLQIAGVNLFIASPLIALRGSAGKGSVLSVETPVLENAIRSGIIVSGATLTSIESNQVITITGTKDAVDSIEQNGYYLHIEDLSDDDIANNRMRLTLIYVANIPTNRLVVTNYLLGA